MYHEVRTIDELADGLRGVVAATVGRPYLVVDGILRQVDVQLTGIAVGILATEVIDAVGDVARLLYLGKEVAGTDGVQATGRQKEEVAVVGLVGGDDVLHGGVVARR